MSSLASCLALSCKVIVIGLGNVPVVNRELFNVGWAEVVSRDDHSFIGLGSCQNYISRCDDWGGDEFINCTVEGIAFS